MDRCIAILLLLTALSWSLHGSASVVVDPGEAIAEINHGMPVDQGESNHTDETEQTAETEADDRQSLRFGALRRGEDLLDWADTFAPASRVLHVPIRPPIG